MNARLEPQVSAAPFSEVELKALRADFPILHQEVQGHPLVYLDNAATTQKPRPVIEALSHYYEHDNANVHRGIHQLSERATRAYESARDRVQRFLNAPRREEIVFVRGTTEAINLVAHSFLRPRLQAGDEVLISAMEHHSNIVPWQLLCEEVGAHLRVIPMDKAGNLLLDEVESLFSEHTRLLGLVHVSNALGTINPVRELTQLAHRHGVPVLLDGAQATAHLAVDVQALDCDFYAFSGHKVFGPTGIGVLYGKGKHLQTMRPYQGGGEMIRQVRFEGSEYAPPPHRFEAGTPNIAGVIGLGAALDYVTQVGLSRIHAHEAALLAHAQELAGQRPWLRQIGTAREKAGIFGFLIEGVHAHDVGTIVDHQGVAIRAGHHCAMPVMEFFGVAATTRASFALYNTHAEVEALFHAIDKVHALFQP